VSAVAAAAASGVAAAAALVSGLEVFAAGRGPGRPRPLPTPARRRLMAGLPAGALLALACAASGSAVLVPVAAAVPWVAALGLERISARRIRRQADRALPALAGSVGAALAAGLRPVDALATACRHREDPLGLAVRRACSRIGAGVPLDEALGLLTAEIPGGRLASLCTALSVASRRGTDATEPVRSIASAARTADLIRRRERAAKAAPAIQLVIALGIVPSVLMLVAAAVLAGVSG